MNASEQENINYDGVFTTENEFSLYEQFNKGDKLRPIGQLYKVKALDPEKHFSFPMLARVINF